MEYIKLHFNHTGAGTLYKALPKNTSVLGFSLNYTSSSHTLHLHNASDDDYKVPQSDSSEDHIMGVNTNPLNVFLPEAVLVHNPVICSVAAGAVEVAVTVWIKRTKSMYKGN